jgi:hypothetical protein
MAPARWGDHRTQELLIGHLCLLSDKPTSDKKYNNADRIITSFSRLFLYMPLMRSSWYKQQSFIVTRTDVALLKLTRLPH